MSELNIPEHWSESKLGELVYILDNLRKPISANKRIDGIYPYYGANGIQGYHNEFIFNDKLLLVAEDGGHFGSKEKDIAYIVEGKFWVNNHAHVIKNKEGINLNYLFQYLRRFNVKPWVTGATVPKLNQAKLRDLPVAVPPLGEQERIVQKIESCFQKIDETEKALNDVEILLTKYRESLLAKAFRGELIPQDPKDEPTSKLLEKIRAERAKKSNGKKVQEFTPISDDEKPFDLPEGWEWVRLNEVCSLIADIDHKMPKAVPKGVIFLSAKDLKDNGVLDFSNPKYISREDFERLSRKVQPQRGDIIYSRIGARLGKARVVNVDTEFIVSYSCCTIRPIKDIVDVNFLNSYLDSGFVLDQALRDVKGIGVPDLGMDKIKNFVLPLPSIKTQRAILKAINLFETNIKEVRLGVETKIQLLTKLKESLLTNAFQGLLVPRVLNEGTGQELLAKIQEMKEQVDTSPVNRIFKKTIKKTSKKKATK